METRTWLGIALLKIAALYLLISLGVGLWMAISNHHSLSSVHSHLGLLGWGSMAIAGLVYLVIPRCTRGPLAALHFWLHNVGLPIMLASLAVLYWLGESRVEPLIGIGSVLVVAGLLAFSINVVKNAGKADGT